MSILNSDPAIKRRAAANFLGFFPDWRTFSRDIDAHRDMKDPAQKRMEGYVVQAIDMLADLVGRTHDDLEGQYYATQERGNGADVFRDDLMNSYIEVVQAYGDPAVQLQGIEGL